jgi:hypothetical protein
MYLYINTVKSNKRKNNAAFKGKQLKSRKPLGSGWGAKSAEGGDCE